MGNDKLKGALRARGKTYADCAKAIGISTTAFSQKINEKSTFDIIEVNAMVSYLDLSKTEAVDIFFENKLA